MTTFSETSSVARDNQKKIQETNPVRNMAKSSDEKKEYTPENLKSWKNQELCKVHTTRNLGKCDSPNDDFQNEKNISDQTTKAKLNIYSQVTPNTPNVEKDHEVAWTDTDPPDGFMEFFKKATQNSRTDTDIYSQLTPNTSNVEIDREVAWTDTDASDSLLEFCKRAIQNSQTDTYSHNSKHASQFTETKSNTKEREEKGTVDAEEKDRRTSEPHNSNFPQPFPLPDILNTFQSNTLVDSKAAPAQNVETDSVKSLENEKKSKSVLTMYVPQNSDSFSNETEAELKKLRTLQSLKANQFMYKLAYDENITDQSNSRSPSPVDPETQVPSSLPNSEILIHEAGSDSEAGSEDVELISHRYESETSLNENKHMYVNKLSLAVELLRTQETLPYDEHFRRVSIGAKRDTTGEVNFAYVDDSFSMGSLEAVVTTQAEPSHLGNEEMTESCEMAKEVVETVTSPASREGNRRFQVPFRHYFSPRAMLVNPCSCCLIM